MSNSHVVDQVAHVGVLDRGRRRRRPAAAQCPRRTPLRSGHVGHDVVGDDHVGALALGDAALRRARTPKNSSSVGTPAVGRGTGRSGAGRCRGRARRTRRSSSAGSRRCSRSRRRGCRRSESPLLDEPRSACSRLWRSSSVGERREVRVVVDEQLARPALPRGCCTSVQLRAERHVEREAAARVEVERSVSPRRRPAGVLPSERNGPQTIRSARATRWRHRTHVRVATCSAEASQTPRSPVTADRRRVLRPDRASGDTCAMRMIDASP